jgi:hypothetical protein
MTMTSHQAKYWNFVTLLTLFYAGKNKCKVLSIPDKHDITPKRWKFY